MSRALQRERERVILIQGAPGSGKSVAVRHFARSVLEQAEKSRLKQRRLAICVSLRDFDCNPDEVTAETLRAYIAEQVNPQKAVELTAYLETQFIADIASGDVVILLDSFDEIPGVLGTRNIDAAVLPYVRAISSLVGGGASQCVVASREYKGPRVEGWTRLELVGLSFEEQVKLLSNYGLDTAQVGLVEPLLLDPRTGFSADLRNPLNLALLASFISAHGDPPTRPSELFEDYIDTRLNEAALDEDLQLEPLVAALESFAFGLLRQTDAGLSGDSTELLSHLKRAAGSSLAADTLFGVVKQSKLVVQTRRAKPSTRLAFAHRRVQEYFATEYVRHHPAELGPDELARNPRWRETAVTLLQVSPEPDQEPLLRELLAVLQDEIDKNANDIEHTFEWSSQTVHALELIVSAYSASPEGVPTDLVEKASDLVEAAWGNGTIGDRKFALDCLPAARTQLQGHLINSAFSGVSDWLRLTALRDCATLHPLPDGIARAIRKLLITAISGGRLSRDARLLDGDLRRLYEGKRYIRVRRLLAAAPIVLLAICVVHVAYDYWSGAWSVNIVSIRAELLVWVLFPLAIFWLFQATEPLSFGARSAIRRFFDNVMRRAFGWQVQDYETEVFATLLMGMVAIASIGDIIQGTVDIVGGRYLVASGDLFIRPALAVYALAWGPVVLVAVHQGWFSPTARLYEGAFIFRRAVPEVRKRAAYARPLAKVLLVGLCVQAIIVGVLFGAIYLLEHFGGGAGTAVVKIVGIGVLAVLPVIIVVSVAWEVRSSWRVKRKASEQQKMTPAVLLEALTSFKEPSETAAYLELLRVHQNDQLRQLPRPFLRQLARLIEASKREDEDLATGSSVLEPSLRSAVDERRLSPARLASWDGDVLDQLGRIDESLRER